MQDSTKKPDSTTKKKAKTTRKAAPNATKKKVAAKKTKKSVSRKAKTTPSRTASTVAPAAPTQPRQPVENSVLAASPQTAPTRRTVSADERRELIAERAYDKARQRGFRNGTPQGDWLAAEAEVDALLRRDAEA